MSSPDLNFVGAFRSVSFVVALIVCVLVSGCAQDARRAEEAPREIEREESPLSESLLKIADSRLAAGDLPGARIRFDRVLKVNPSSVRARVGLAELARRRGDVNRQRRLLHEILDVDPRHMAALLSLARVEAASGRRDEALRLLEIAREKTPMNPALLAALEDLTGPARPVLDTRHDEVLEVSAQHPLDPHARLQAARIRVQQGDLAAARRDLLASYWLADLDPVAARDAIRMLREIAPEWADTRVVEVHSYADETVHHDPAWKMRVRVLWWKLSRTLAPVLDTVFIPVSITPFTAGPIAPDLASLRIAWSERIQRFPRNGIVVAFTERPPPRHRGARLGEAELLGRLAIVRLNAGENQSRVLIHEVLHLYGAVHIAKDLDSIMNPSGESLALDPANAEILEKTRGRLFDSRGVQANVFPYVETSELIEAYIDALRLDLVLRECGIARARQASEESRILARAFAQVAVGLDPDLAQIALMIGAFHARDGLFAVGADYVDLAARLQGVDSKTGRRLRARADRMRRTSALIHDRAPPAQ